MGRAANSATTAAWRERFVRQRRSGLSVAEFCRRKDVSPASFYAWRKRLKADKANSQPRFVPLEMDLAETAGGGVQIELPGGAVVRLPEQASAELIATAIHAAIHAAMHGAMHGVSIDEVSPC